MNPSPDRPSRWQIMLTIRGDHRVKQLLRQPGSVQALNKLVGQLASERILDAVWMGDEEPPPCVAAIEFDGMGLSGMKLDGIDLLHVSVCGADFSGATLRGARFGMCDGADFHRADLTGANFALASISGCSFDGADLTNACFDGATFTRADPPRSLDQINLCRPQDWSPPAGRRGHPPLPWVSLRAVVQLLDVGALLGDGD